MNLTEFEVLVLSGVIAAGTDAYSVPIFEEVEQLLPAKKKLSHRKMYVTLDHLEQYGFVRSWSSKPGGRTQRPIAPLLRDHRRGKPCSEGGANTILPTPAARTDTTCGATLVARIHEFLRTLYTRRAHEYELHEGLKAGLLAFQQMKIKDPESRELEIARLQAILHELRQIKDPLRGLVPMWVIRSTLEQVVPELSVIPPAIPASQACIPETIR